MVDSVRSSAAGRVRRPIAVFLLFFFSFCCRVSLGIRLRHRNGAGACRDGADLPRAIYGHRRPPVTLTSHSIFFERSTIEFWIVDFQLRPVRISHGSHTFRFVFFYFAKKNKKKQKKTKENRTKQNKNKSGYAHWVRLVYFRSGPGSVCK